MTFCKCFRAIYNKFFFHPPFIPEFATFFKKLSHNFFHIIKQAVCFAKKATALRPIIRAEGGHILSFILVSYFVQSFFETTIATTPINKIAPKTINATVE